MTLLITGGTGNLGRLLMSRLPGPVRSLSWATGGDLSTGVGVDEALAGVETVVHCAGSAKGDDEKARVLVRAARRAGVRHIVFISVVGADRVPVVSAMDRMSFGYYAAKLGAADRLADLALGAPAGLVAEIGGPRVYGLSELTRSYLEATGRRRPVAGIRFTGAAFRAMRDGANLTPGHATGTRTWEDFLADQVPRDSVGGPLRS